MKDATLAGHLLGGRLQVSYNDGKTWHHVRLTGRTGSWTTHLVYPADPSRLRATAWDSRGNRVTQEINRACVLR